MILLLLLLALAWTAQAQVASGTLLGEVRDESGAVAPGVRMTAREEGTRFSRSVVTGPLGSYQMDDLLPGRYTVTAEKQGFRTVEIRGVVLEVNQKTRLDFALKVGAEHENLVVRAEISPLQTEEPSVGYRLDHPTLTALPLNVRNVISLVTLGPGAVPRHLGGFTHDVINDIQEGSRGAVAVNPPINGARSTMNTFLLDGAYNTDRHTFALAVNPPLEAVQEFRIQTSLASAEFAQAGGGTVDVVTRAGSRNFHGSAGEFFRNEGLDARNFFEDPKLPRPVLRRHLFAGALGGPMPFPRSFFFAAYEGLRSKTAKASVGVVPDTALRGGDFRGRAPIFDPLNPDPATGQRRPFPNNIIPPERIDPIARRYLEKYEPLPNRPGAGSNYLDSTPNENTHDLVSSRVDHQWRQNNWFFGRYTINEERGRVFATFPELPSSERVRAQQAVVGQTRAGATWLQEARFSFTRLRLFEVPQSALRTNVARELGMEGVPDDPFTYGLPLFLVTNFSTVADSPTLPQVQRDNTWNLSAHVSVARRQNAWKFGFQWIHSHLNYVRTQDVRGRYTFTGAFTGNPALPGPSGDPFADFLLGFPQVTSRNVGSTQAYLRQNSYAWFLQDDWRPRGSLTVNLGLRYEYVSPYTEQRSRLLNLDYSTFPGPPRLARVSSPVEPDRNNFAPRLGLAWRLSRQTVFRAAYGVYFSPEISVETYDLILNSVRSERNQTDGSRAPLLTLRNGFPLTAATGFPSYYGLDRGARTPYVQQWSGGFQHEFRSHVVAEAAYLGTKGTKLGRFRTFNTPLHVETGENLPPRPGDLQSLRTFPQLGPIFQRQHVAQSSYHSLQLKAEKRFSRQLTFLSSFVWSKSIDDADSVIPGLFDSFGAQDERNLRLERGLSFFHVGRRFSAGFVYDLPGAGWMRPVLRDWRLSGIVTLQDGTPLNPVYFALDRANSGTPNRPDVVPGVKVLLPRRQRTVERFFNTEAFRAPQPYHFGNAGRNILPGPGNNIFDLALHRRFPLRESRVLEVRAEAFNLFNHPNWGVPGPYPDFGPFFGRILTTGEPRRIQLGLRIDF